MSPLIFDDNDVRRLSMSSAVACMERAFRQHVCGEMVAPQRMSCDVGAGQLVFTPGGFAAERVLGFRFYDLHQLASPDRSELTAVFSAEDGSLRGIVTGTLLGAVRTGAIGGVAVNQLAPPQAQLLAVIGTGLQARTQLAAACAVNDFQSIRVYSRDPQRCARFAQTMGEQLQCRIESATGVHEAVDQADVVICATTSETPVLETDWLQPQAHVTTVGPKFREAHELPIDIYERATTISTDTPAQFAAFGEAMHVSGASNPAPIQPLSSFVAHQASRADGLSIFISLGLAGTEVLLANELMNRSP